MTLPCWEGRFSLAERCDVDEFAFSIEIRIIILLRTAFAQNVIILQHFFSGIAFNTTRVIKLTERLLCLRSSQREKGGHDDISKQIVFHW